MAYSIKEGEFKALLATSDLHKRYGYCLKKIADNAALFWLESDEGRCVIGPDERGVTLLPVWPHPRFAMDYLERDAFAKCSWIGAEPVEVNVDEFLEEHMPRLITNNYGVAAFPVAPGRAAVVSADEFKANLEYELSQVE